MCLLSVHLQAPGFRWFEGQWCARFGQIKSCRAPLHISVYVTQGELQGDRQITGKRDVANLYLFLQMQLSEECCSIVVRRRHKIKIPHGFEMMLNPSDTVESCWGCV